MDFTWLKRFMPRSLYGRALLILIVPVVTVQLVVSVVFIQRHFEGVTRQMSAATVDEVAVVLERADPALAEALGIEVAAAAARPDRALSRHWYDLSGRIVWQSFASGLPGIQAMDLGEMSQVQLWVGGDGPLRKVSFPRERVSASNPHQLLVLMVLASAVMTLVAFLYLRNQLRPIKRMAEAAEAFGKGRIVTFRPSGATEVRAAGNAFLEMRARIERQVATRTAFLSGVSHDLRTPLTRLRLGLSLLSDDSETQAMRRDIDEMQQMLDSFLAFAQGESGEDPPVETDPFALVARLVEDFGRAGQSVRLGDSEGAGTLPLRPASLRRALDNLVGNAVRYAGGAEVSVALLPRALRLVVEDSGPGIAAQDRAEALRPFSRLDLARNQNAGQGVGLGLTIAADIARSHGGSLTLGQSERLGGLKAEIVIAR